MLGIGLSLFLYAICFVFLGKEGREGKGSVWVSYIQKHLVVCVLICVYITLKRTSEGLETHSMNMKKRNM